MWMVFENEDLQGASTGQFFCHFMMLRGEGTFREYSPHMMILAAIMQTNKKLWPTDFVSLFERMRLELESITKDPLQIIFDGVVHKVRLELFQSILDMDVRLFREFQQKYSSCRRLEKFAVCLRGDLMVVAHIAPLKGLQLKRNQEVKSVGILANQLLSTIRMILPRLYNFALPTLMTLFTTPTQWLCLIFLHWLTTRLVSDVHLSKKECEDIDVLAPLLSNYVGVRFPILYTMKFHYLVDHLAKRIRKHGSPLLSSAAPYERQNQTLGRSSNTYTTRTMINVSSRFMALKRATFSCLAIVENWNSDLKMPATMQALGKHLNEAPNTENIDDCPLEKKEEEYLNRYMKNKPVFRSSWSNGRKQFSVRRKCSDRLVHNCYIYYFNKNMDVEFGSIERIFIDEKDRFMILLQRFETRNPFDYLTTNLSNFAQWHNLKIDWNSSNTFFRQIVGCSYSIVDARYLEGYVTVLEFSGFSKTMGKKKNEVTKLLESFGETSKMETERSRKRKGLHKEGPQPERKFGAIIKTENTNIFRASENNNPIFNNPEEAQKKYPNFKPYDVTPLVDKVVSSDESSNNSVEMDDRNESDSMDNARNVHQMSNSSFSLSQHLGKNIKEEPPIERLEAAIKTGNPLSIGQVLREGFSKKTLTEVQVEELCRSVPKPAISLLQFYNDYEQSTPEDRAAIPIGQRLLTKIAMLESRSVDKLQASVNSLASSFVQHTKVAMLVKRTLLRTHTTEATDNFPKIKLSAAYARTNLIGDNGFSQMTYFLTKLFSNLLTPNYAIWKYTYRPRCIRPADKHFELFPKQIADKLIDFAFDCIGIYLPDDLLHGPIDPLHPFLDELDDDCDATKEVERRRAESELVSQTMQSAIGHMLNYIRDYHLDIRTGSLESCKSTKVITTA
ncbi:Protein CBG20947 [Caenorhabditis briggsae]|uniref:Protein CBG20947 n=1 Tax=Caenorhabditis briggsae TaxID=6238 RepID=A8XZ07_CAEBR|nr:Protein CBG20947 [Caenorhabditis briggsae]CAP37874.1 Protein CBG20947 [Caenorhabditis briggsae]